MYTIRFREFACEMDGDYGCKFRVFDMSDVF